MNHYRGPWCEHCEQCEHAHDGKQNQLPVAPMHLHTYLLVYSVGCTHVLNLYKSQKIQMYIDMQGHTLSNELQDR